jgi:hypothetical protein
MKKFVIGKLMGRCGNQFYQTANAIAYALRNDYDYSVTPTSVGSDKLYFPNFTKRDISASLFEERRHADGRAVFSAIPPKMENVMLVGYWQSFEYFNEFREHILESFNIPYERKNGVVSIHVRRGDFETAEGFSVLPLEYYQKAISHFINLGYSRFIVFSDDIEKAKELLSPIDSLQFTYSEGRTELEDLSEMSSCEHNILANSSFSFVASWLNQNEEKIVLCPDENHLFAGNNDRMIPDEYIKVVF